MAEENTVLLPRFFKVFLAVTSSESLLIPMTFMEHLHEPLPKTVKLQGTGGGVWTASLKKIREQAYLTDGWSKFAEDHELKTGEFLTFVYDGHRIFEISVYGRFGCKEIRAVREVVPLSDSAHEDEAEENSLSIYPLDSENTKTDGAVVAESSNSQVNPCFETYLKPRMYELLIPAFLVKWHKLRFGSTIKYIDEEGTLVGERGKFYDGRVCFKAWDRICRRNKLKDGDTVKCEILHTAKLVHSVKVHVKRANE